MTKKIFKSVRELRKAKKLTQKDMAQAVGISTPSIVAYESGRTTPSRKVVDKINETFGVELRVVRKPRKARGAKPVKMAMSAIILQRGEDQLTLRDILKKTGKVGKLIIRLDENKAYWVKDEESGSVDLW